ncbi:MAG: MOSC domain-containing protein [Deltaproteobacteria bacterium]|jgi:MOSC domain-containing protein YiiM|nr:MOSC domain-containing protein [Deltaproteobacteria bacterium]
MFGKLVAVCLSPAKGTPKKAVDRVLLRPDHGVENDAHAGRWHRQVSLLDYAKVEAFNARGGAVEHGAFGENLVVAGYDLRELPVGSRLQIGPALLEVTQIGKECHSRCEIFHRVGDCIMPREGIFAKVLVGGEVGPGDDVRLLDQPGEAFGGAAAELADAAVEAG